MPKEFEGKKVMTPKFRCASVRVFKPEAFEEGKDEMYSITMLFPRGTDISRLNRCTSRGPYWVRMRAWPVPF